MSFLEKIGISSPLKEEDKIKTPQQSVALIESYIQEYAQLIEFKNHKKYNSNIIQNTYKFTIKILSLDFLRKLGADKRVKNVFFCPASPPPGGAFDAISMRYKVIVEYY